MPKFVHSPLQKPQRQIRLLRFSAGSDAVDLRCSLSTHNLHDAPEFVALSYECGSPDATLDIIVEGRTYTIRHNLSLLLGHIQRRPQCLDAVADGFIWVDAICISQTDTDEKNVQVAMMGSIYQAAVTTYAWLGWPDRFDARPVYDFMMDAASPANQASISEYCDALRSNAMLMGTRTIDLLPQVSEWCCSSYFKRRWVVQEIFLSKMVILVCGESAIRMPLIKPLMRVIETLSIYPYGDRYAKSIRNTLPYMMVKFVDQYAHKPVNELDPMYEGHSTSSPSSEPDFLPPKASLHAVLDAFQATKCERVHDSLYAILSLVKGGDRIAVDYLLRPEELLSQVLSQKGWSDIASVKATTSALGLKPPITWQESDVDREKTDFKGNINLRPLLPAQEVTCLGHIQTIFEIPKHSRDNFTRESLEIHLTYEGSTLHENIRIVKNFFGLVEGLPFASLTSRDYVPLDDRSTEQGPELFLSDRGYAGICEEAKPGDAVCVLHRPFDIMVILREQEKRHFRMIGTAASCDMNSRTNDLVRKTISTIPPPPEAVSLPSTAKFREAYEDFVSRHDVLRRFCAAKAHANSSGKQERYSETLDVQIDMWDWVQFASSNLSWSSMRAGFSSLLRRELTPPSESDPIPLPRCTEL